MENIEARANGLDFEHIGWKYYHTIRKKAMEQEFSWSGLLVSLSIAFFIVIASAYFLSLLYSTMGLDQISYKFNQKKIYRLEIIHTYSIDNYLQVDLIGENRIENINTANLA